MADELEKLTYETAVAALEETVMRLSTEELTLEEALALFEKGQKLHAYCTSQLETATLRVEQLTADGEIIDISDT